MEVVYKLTSDYVLYFNGRAEILLAGDRFVLVGVRLSSGLSSKYHYKDDIIELPNAIVKHYWTEFKDDV